VMSKNADSAALIHHVVARTSFRGIQQTDEVVFCRITEMGFLRLLTNRRVMGEDAVNPKAAWKIYDIILFLIHFIYSFATGSLCFWRASPRRSRAQIRLYLIARLSRCACGPKRRIVTRYRQAVELIDRKLGARSSGSCDCGGVASRDSKIRASLYQQTGRWWPR
jgi:hypothetical protein